MRTPVLCIITEVPRLGDLIIQRCSSLAKKVTIVSPNSDKPSDRGLIEEADVIVSEPHLCQMWLNGLPNLKLVHGTWTGIDSMMTHVYKQKAKPSFTYCRLGESFDEAMAEYVTAYIVAQERNFRMTYDAQAQSLWSHEIMEYIWYNTRSLKTLSIGILGIGNIGRTVARVCKSFGMRVCGLVTTVPADDKKSPYVDEYRLSSELDTILADCDYICNILPSTPLTQGLLDNDRFKACAAKRAVFMNVGRGDVCSEESILRALDQGWLRAAILDVVPTEPLSSDSLLWKHPDITITCHVAAVSRPEQIVELIVENIENYVHERPLKHVIDWDKGY